jgi:hypothetical protein
VNPLTSEPLLGHEGRRAWEGLLVQAEQGLLSGMYNLKLVHKLQFTLERVEGASDSESARQGVFVLYLCMFALIP